MSQKVITCCKCKKMFSFNTRYLRRAESEEDKKGEKKVFNVPCGHCGAENKVEI